MYRFVSLALLAACAVNPALATPQASICFGYQWGVIIEELDDTPIPVYNQYVQTTSCAGPAWVQSSTEPTPPTSISPWGTTYECQVPEIQYYCSVTPVATCCGNLTASA